MRYTSKKSHRTAAISLFKMLEIANHIRIKTCIISKSHLCSRYHRRIDIQEAAARQVIEVFLSTSFLLFCQRKSFQYVESE